MATLLSQPFQQQHADAPGSGQVFITILCSMFWSIYFFPVLSKPICSRNQTSDTELCKQFVCPRNCIGSVEKICNETQHPTPLQLCNGYEPPASGVLSVHDACETRPFDVCPTGEGTFVDPNFDGVCESGHTMLTIESVYPSDAAMATACYPFEPTLLQTLFQAAIAAACTVSP